MQKNETALSWELRGVEIALSNPEGIVVNGNIIEYGGFGIVPQGFERGIIRINIIANIDNSGICLCHANWGIFLKFSVNISIRENQVSSENKDSYGITAIVSERKSLKIKNNIS